MEGTFSGIRLSGKTVYHGITIGKVMVLRNDKDQIRRRKIADPAREIERVRMAVDVSKQQLAAIYHQAVKKLGKGLRISARACDGTVEGIEDEEGLIMGVQWHPEDLVDSAPVMNRLFVDLVERALRR